MMRRLSILLSALMTASACGGSTTTETLSPATSSATTTLQAVTTTTTALLTTTTAVPTTTTASPDETVTTTAALLTTTVASPDETVTTTTALTTTTVASTTTAAAGPVIETERQISWDDSCVDVAVETSYGRRNATLLYWNFYSDPNLASLEIRTRPSEAASGDVGSYKSGGFGLVNYRSHAIPVHADLEYEFALPRGPGNRVVIDVELVTGHADGTSCESTMFTGIVPPELTDVEAGLTVPTGVSVNLSRYADMVIPDPTLEALIYAFADYTGPHGMGEQEPEYSAWQIADDKVILDYEPELRHFLFGDTQDLGDWEAAAQMLEILNVIHPDLDPRFATTIHEVSFPQFHPLCERWMLVGGRGIHPCRRGQNSAYFSRGNSDYENSRGFVYHNTWVVDSEDLTQPDAWPQWEIGVFQNNPCCTINFHEFGHAVGLNHTYCAYNAMSTWEDRPHMTRPWGADDLAGMAIHLDPRTETGMDIYQAAVALGIAQDSRFSEMIKKPWRACGRQDSGWNDFADRIYEDHVLSINVGTNHPDNRTPIRYDR